MGNLMESTRLSILLVIFAIQQTSTSESMLNTLHETLALDHATEDVATKQELGDLGKEPNYIVKYHALPWNEAKASCERIGGSARLAFPTSESEFLQLQRIVRGVQYQRVTGTDYKLMAWLGISNLDNFRTWRNLNGDDINSTEFHRWSGNNGGVRSNPKEPHCAGVDALNPGLRDWWCHLPLIYICRVN